MMSRRHYRSALLVSLTFFHSGYPHSVSSADRVSRVKRLWLLRVPGSQPRVPKAGRDEA